MIPISVDVSKMSLKDGKLIIPVAGFQLTLEIIPDISIAPELYQGEAMLHANVSLADSTIKEIEGAIKTQEQLNEFLLKEPALPSHWKFDDILLGFIYSTPEEPYNYNWFLQLRRQGKFVERLFSPTNVNIRCPLSTHSWFEGGNWHGRFCFSKKDVVEVQRVGSDLVVVGKSCGGYPIQDLSEIPEGCTRIVIRYDIRKNKWYLHYQKEGQDVKVTEVDDILADVPMHGNVNRNYAKPRVTQYILVEDIAHIKILSNVATIYGK